MTTGHWAVIDTTNLEVLVTNADGPEQHDVIRFSPGWHHIVEVVNISEVSVRIWHLANLAHV